MGKLCMFKILLANDDDDENEPSNDAFDLVEERSSLVEQSSHDPKTRFLTGRHPLAHSKANFNKSRGA